MVEIRKILILRGKMNRRKPQKRRVCHICGKDFLSLMDFSIHMYFNHFLIKNE